MEKVEKEIIISRFGDTPKENPPLDSGSQIINEESSNSLQIVNTENLEPLKQTSSLPKYVADVFSRRQFIIADAKGRAFRTTRDYRWWKFWIVASPLLDAALYGTLFGFLLRTDRGIDNFVGFLILGITFFSVMNKMLMAGSGLIQANRSMIQAFTFPRSAIVLSQALRYVIDTIPSVGVGIVIALLFQLDKPFSWTIILVLPIFGLLIMFSTGLMFIAARITASFPDFRALIEVFSRGWMFLSGVFYSVDRFAGRPRVYEAMTWNPAHLFIDSIRNVVLWGNSISLEHWLTLSAWGLGSFIVGFIFFWTAEDQYGRAW